MIRPFILLIALGFVSASRFFTPNVDHQRYMWDNFKREHSKDYVGPEDSYRFSVFVKNLQLIDERNDAELANGGEAVHGITKFMDLTQDEFRKQFLLADVNMKTNNVQVADVAPLAEGLTVAKDWTGVYTTPVKNQGQCGSCWAFSATEQIESDTMRTLGVSYVLSPQQIVSCDGTCYGCNGGWTERAYSYVSRAGGLQLESSYPYTSPPTGSCKANSAYYKVTVSNYYTVKGESSMANYVGGTGPLSVCLDADNWSTYTGGVMSVCGTNVDHCVQAVGVNTGTGGYWKVRNSWGTGWGESGHIRLAYGHNTCAITNDPTYTSVKRV